MTNKLFEKYKVKIELLSPLFTGSGKEYYPNEYYWDKNRENILHLIDFKNLKEECRKKRIDLVKELQNDKYYENYQSPSAKGLFEGFSLTKFFKQNKIVPQRISEFQLEVKRNSERGIKNLPSIRQFIKDGNKNYFIPGSSLKGCFRTLYLWNEFLNISQNQKKALIKFNSWKVKFKKKADEDFQKGIEKKHTQLFQKFRVSDLYFEDFQVSITQIFRTARSQIPQFAEIIEKGTAKGEIWIEEFGKVKKEDLENLKLENFQGISKNFLFYLAKSQNRTAKKQMKLLEGKVSSLKDNEMIIRLGFGKGFDFSTVGDWIKGSLEVQGIKLWFPNIKQRLDTPFDFPLSYWKTFNGNPLGWVKLSFEKINN